MKVLVLQNITRETPGLIADVLQSRSILSNIVDLGAGGAPPSLDGYDALVVMGGPDSANDKTPKMEAELATVRQALKRGLPYLGVCLGLQVLVKAAGGQVVPGEVREIGFFDSAGEPFTVELTAEGKTDPVFGGLEDSFRVFQLHGETVVLTPGMTLLATGAHCRNQIVRVGDRAYGVQSHFELTPGMLSVWASEDPDLQPLDASHLQSSYKAIQSHYQATAHTIFGRFLDLVESSH